MLKALPAALAALLCAASHADSFTPSGAWQPFSQEVVFEADVVEMDSALSYWVKPRTHDLKVTKHLMDDMRSPYVILDPFVFQVHIAGLSTGMGPGKQLSNDGFEAEAYQQARDTLVNHDYQFRCYGRFADLPMPVCSAIDAQGQSAGVSLVRKGMYTLDKTFTALPALERSLMLEAQAAAQADGKGVWKPFMQMFRGLQ